MNSIKSIIIFLIVAALLVFGITWFTSRNQSNSDLQNDTQTSAGSETTNPNTSPDVSTTQPETGATYTLAQVSTHSKPTDCWAIVRTSVYNLTSWISQHPGGADAILSLCGKDGTAAFEGQHGGQSRPESELYGFKIGTYIK